MGITHELFNDEAKYATQRDGAENVILKVKDDQGVDQNQSCPKSEHDILEWFKHIYVKEVVREPKIHYQRVPRLGSYMAIPLIYKNCLFVESIEAAARNCNEVMKRREEQEADKLAFQQKMDEEKAQADAQGVAWVPSEEKEWEAIELDDFITREEKYVVCIDTMGQDRELNDEQKRFALKTVDDFIGEWEAIVTNQAVVDRDIRAGLLRAEPDAEYEAEYAAGIAKEIEEFQWPEGAEDTIYFGKHVPEEDRIPNEELTNIENSYKYLKVIAQRLMPSQEKRRETSQLVDMKNFYVIKYPQIIQVFLFLTGSKNTDICLPNTNKMEWKKVRDA